MENFEQYVEHLFSLDNPILYSVFFTTFLIIFLILLYKGVFDPLKKRFIKEKGELENKNVKLMALFAELDPDPLMRIDESGVIIQINDATKKLFGDRSIIGEPIQGFLTFLDLNIQQAIQENISERYTEKLVVNRSSE